MGRRQHTSRRQGPGAAVGTVLRALALTCILTATACGGSSAGTAADGDDSAPTAFDALAQPGRVPELIRDHLGASPEIRRLTLHSSGFTVQVRDPDKRDNLDDYSYTAGEWTSRPVSVTLSEISDYESVTFSLGDIAWDRVPGLIDQALDGLDLEGEEVGAVGFDRLSGERPRVYISVSGLRGSGRLIANADGTGVDVQRN